MKKGLIGIGMAAVILCTGTMSVFAHGHGHAHMCYQWAQQINTNAVANANAANPTKTVMSNTSGVKQMTVNTAVIRCHAGKKSHGNPQEAPAHSRIKASPAKQGQHPPGCLCRCGQQNRIVRRQGEDVPYRQPRRDDDAFPQFPDDRPLNSRILFDASFFLNNRNPPPAAPLRSAPHRTRPAPPGRRTGQPSSPLR